VDFVKLAIEDYKLDNHFGDFSFYETVEGFTIDYKYQVCFYFILNEIQSLIDNSIK
jgi:hypothetical protein